MVTAAGRAGRPRDRSPISGPGSWPKAWPADSPLRAIMSAPLVSIEASALVYEAILAMREKNVDHLLVRDESGPGDRHRPQPRPSALPPVLAGRPDRRRSGTPPSPEAIAAARRGSAPAGQGRWSRAEPRPATSPGP
ncbi:MAG: hypothetical protein MZW92_62225 [Comamonadaceae bacterium]|nr:hypothetical protein [Comamonadaceae bacterium]